MINNIYKIYKKQIKDAIKEVKYYENKYGLSSEEFIKDYRYGKGDIDLDFGDGSRWAILYLCTVKPYLEYVKTPS